MLFAARNHAKSPMLRPSRIGYGPPDGCVLNFLGLRPILARSRLASRLAIRRGRQGLVSQGDLAVDRPVIVFRRGLAGRARLRERQVAQEMPSGDLVRDTHPRVWDRDAHHCFRYRDGPCTADSKVDR